MLNCDNACILHDGYWLKNFPWFCEKCHSKVVVFTSRKDLKLYYSKICCSQGNQCDVTSITLWTYKISGHFSSYKWTSRRVARRMWSHPKFYQLITGISPAALCHSNASRRYEVCTPKSNLEKKYLKAIKLTVDFRMPYKAAVDKINAHFWSIPKCLSCLVASKLILAMEMFLFASVQQLGSHGNTQRNGPTSLCLEGKKTTNQLIAINRAYVSDWMGVGKYFCLT